MGIRTKISNFKLGIGFPLGFTMVPADFFFGVLEMERPDFLPLRVSNGPIDAMRNELVVKAINNNCSHLIMMDTDMVYHPETIPKLLSHKLPIVGALCNRRYPPFDPLLLEGDPIKGYTSKDTWEENELVEVDATGTGCLMFNTSVFRDMPAPWFKFRPNPNDTIGGVIGEDIGFSWDLKKAGFRIFVDASLPSIHLTTLGVNMNTYKLYKAMKIKQNEKIMEDGLMNNNKLRRI